MTRLLLDLVRVTESAALAAGRWVGRTDKEGVDRVAVDAMRASMATVPIDGVVVIGEGEKDDAPMLFNGERVGAGGVAYDVAVDPVDGTTLTSKGQPGGVTVLAVSPRGTMYDPGAAFYMEKLVTGRAAAAQVDIEAPVADNVRAVAKAKGGRPEDVTVVLLDRPRNRDLARQAVAAGARIRYIQDGDVVAAVLAAREGTGVDLLLGIGGTPEGVVTACAVKCLGATIQGRLRPQTDEESARVRARGQRLDRVLTEDDLVAGDDAMFVVTGVTGCELVGPVSYRGDSGVTESLAMHSRSGAVHVIRSEHRLRPGPDRSVWD